MTNAFKRISAFDHPRLYPGLTHLPGPCSASGSFEEFDTSIFLKRGPFVELDMSPNIIEHTLSNCVLFVDGVKLCGQNLLLYPLRTKSAL